ncbi:alpha-mannosidase [Plakobranchus ocellatus]|uniref:Alpha-mannosidase n=1 Tax=Plakobranchus ocellatus TaxID=259542 RepID=A0AAV3Z4L4_9GAST|nr:alpha-mannosidase [Plakobranchus ocellatus]
MAKAYVKLSAWQLTVVFSFLYMLLVFLVYRQLEKTTSDHARRGQVFKPRIDNQGSLQLYVKECPKIYTPKRQSGYKNHVDVKSLKESMCHSQKIPPNPSLQMEKMWSTVSVKYPQYVYTTSGWIQVIDVPNYNPKPLKVFIVPHSHQDPGWLETFDGYYHSYTTKTLHNIVTYLSKNPTWKFIWSEVAFLEKWFNEPSSPRKQFKELVSNGQLEIVTGGWVMADEAVTHFTALLDQLVEGHLWLKQNLGILPNVSWSVDPFGHSPTMPYLLKKAGIDKMVIQRVHFGIKRHLAQRRQLEFMWRQAWDSDGKTDILCHMMPFLLYAIHYSCGPDPHVCCQFDFHREQCLSGSKRVPVVTVNKDNIRKLAWSMWEQFQKKAHLYQSNILLVPHGDDFRYTSQEEWLKQFGNLNKLMDYINKNQDMNMQVQFGTLSDYFNALARDTAKSKLAFPSMSGDFLPYNDRDDQYWTGFYSNRPLYKYMSRILQAKLRITEILCTMTFAQPLLGANFTSRNSTSVLVSARRTLALFQHHDAITGTSRRYVMEDYWHRLRSAIKDVNNLLATLNYYWMTNVKLKPKATKERLSSVFMSDDWSSLENQPRLKISHSEGTWHVIVTNPHTIAWTSPVTVRTINPSLVKTKNGTLIPSQCNPVLGPEMQPLQGLYDIVFLADVAPLSMRKYQIVENSDKINFARITIFGKHLSTNSFVSEFEPRKSTKPVIEIENTQLKAAFSSCTGTLQSTLRKTDQTVYQTEIKLMTYSTGSWSNPFRDSSGAYIFMPRGHAQEVESVYPNIVVMQGPVASTVLAKLPGLRHAVTLYNTEGPIGAGLHIDNVVNISSQKWNNKEFVMRLETNVYPPDFDWCVDLNGYQMHRKKWRAKFLVQGNYHPMSSMAYIEDEQLSRITLIASHSHGASTQTPGWLEVILDRRLMQDDWRGLKQGVHDNVASPSSFILLPERGRGPAQPKGPSCQPSLLAYLLQAHLNNPQQVALVTDSLWAHKDLKDSVGLLERYESWPCLYSLLNLRHMGTGQQNTAESSEDERSAVMIVHRPALDCSYPEIHAHCDMHRIIHFNTLGGPVNVEIKSIQQTSLTGAADQKRMDVKAAELEDMEIKTFKVMFGPAS